MARSHGKDSRLLLNELHVSGDITGWQVGNERQYADITNPLSAGAQWLPGRRMGTLAISGLFDDQSGTLRAETVAALAAGTDDALTCTVMPQGLTAGTVALICAADPESVVVPAEIGDAVRLDATTKADGYVDVGVILHPLAAETADGDEASVDSGAGTTGGGVAALHVTAFTGLTDAVIKVQHSTDDASWADLITHTTVTAVGHELLAVTGTVNRYLRTSIDVTGTGSITYSLAFARR